jgi:predicted permease
VALFYPKYIFAYITSFVFVGFIVFCFCRKENASAIIIKVMTCGYVSAAIYTLPVITFLLKDPIAAILGNIIQVILLQPIFITALSFITHKEKSIFEKILASLFSPLVYMPIIGLLCNYFQLYMPEFIIKSIQAVGNSASSIALFVFGLSLGNIKIFKKDLNKELLFMPAIKSLIHPILAFYIGKYIFFLDGYWLNALVISASAPTAFSVYLVAKQFSVE